jgi:hypothetical protein
VGYLEMNILYLAVTGKLIEKSQYPDCQYIAFSTSLPHYSAQKEEERGRRKKKFVCAGRSLEKCNFHQGRQIDESWYTIKRILPVIIYRLVSLLAQSDCKNTAKPGFEAAT